VTSEETTGEERGMLLSRKARSTTKKEEGIEENSKRIKSRVRVSFAQHHQQQTIKKKTNTGLLDESYNNRKRSPKSLEARDGFEHKKNRKTIKTSKFPFATSSSQNSERNEDEEDVTHECMKSSRNKEVKEEGRSVNDSSSSTTASWPFHLTVFAGDLNYRLDLPRLEVSRMNCMKMFCA
jgi:hypothetical protein